MPDDKPTSDDVRVAWDANAAYWDEHMEAGKTWQQGLVEPAVEGVLALRVGERVIEIACGNGQFARRMAELGASVLATDFSEPMLERARARGGDVEYRCVDATDETALMALGEAGSFDAVVCNMAIMDMTEIEPMARAAAVLLAPRGRFVFSTLHPSFNSAPGTTRVLEQSDDDSGVVRRYFLKISGYSTSSRGKGVALEDQPVIQWYFHRSLSDLLRPFLASGLVFDALEEPVLPPELVRPGAPEAVFLDIPPILVARLRR
jgi:SAM-dependent methyltransferase